MWTAVECSGLFTGFTKVSLRAGSVCQAGVGAGHRVGEKTHPSAWAPAERPAPFSLVLNCRARAPGLSRAFLSLDPSNNYHFPEGRP